MMIRAGVEPAPYEQQRAFEDAFPGLLRVAMGAGTRILGGGGAAEDVAAEGLARLWIRWRSLGQQPYRDAWLVKVVTNLALDQVKRGAPPKLDAVPAVDPADGIVLREVLVEVLARLPRRQREVIVMHHLYGLSVADTADTLHISPNSVKRHLQRGLARTRGTDGAAQIQGETSA